MKHILNTLALPLTMVSCDALIGWLTPQLTKDVRLSGLLVFVAMLVFNTAYIKSWNAAEKFEAPMTLFPLWRWLFWHRLRNDDRWRRGDIMRHRDGTWDWIDWQDIGWYALAVRSYRRYSVARWWAKKLGKWRLSWDLCPSCNSDAPEIDTCPVCHGHSRQRGDSWPPDNKTKRRWWATFEDRVDCGYE